jgi:hypothetical protein
MKTTELNGRELALSNDLALLLEDSNVGRDPKSNASCASSSLVGGFDDSCRGHNRDAPAIAGPESLKQTRLSIVTSAVSTSSNR